MRLGYGEPVSGVYPNHIDLAYPVWQLKDGAGLIIRNGRRLAKTPVAQGTLVQGLGRIAQEYDLQLLYRPRLRATPSLWDDVLDTIETELLKQECALYFGDRLRGRFLLEDYTWASKDAGYPPDTNTGHGGLFGREVDVKLKLVKALDLTL